SSLSAAQHHRASRPRAGRAMGLADARGPLRLPRSPEGGGSARGHRPRRETGKTDLLSLVRSGNLCPRLESAARRGLAPGHARPPRPLPPHAPRRDALFVRASPMTPPPPSRSSPTLPPSPSAARTATRSASPPSPFSS